MDGDALYTNAQYIVRVAQGPEELRQVFELRYRVFHKELGESATTSDEQEKDAYDEFCHHLIVVCKNTKNIIATERLLPWFYLDHKKGYYSETEFELVNLPKDNILECGRLCIERKYRDSVSLLSLWLGLYQYCVQYKVRYLFGCTSLRKNTSDEVVLQIYHYLKSNGLITEKYHARAKVPLANLNNTHPTVLSDSEFSAVVPKLVKNYIRVGASFIGSPSYDPEFSVYDLLTIWEVGAPKVRWIARFIALKTFVLSQIKRLKHNLAAPIEK